MPRFILVPKYSYFRKKTWLVFFGREQSIDLFPASKFTCVKRVTRYVSLSYYYRVGKSLTFFKWNFFEIGFLNFWHDNFVSNYWVFHDSALAGVRRASLYQRFTRLNRKKRAIRTNEINRWTRRGKIFLIFQKVSFDRRAFIIFAMYFMFRKLSAFA